MMRDLLDEGSGTRICSMRDPLDEGLGTTNLLDEEGRRGLREGERESSREIEF